MSGYFCRSISYSLLTPILLLVSVSCILYLNGCASRKDVVRLQYDLSSARNQIIGLKKDMEQLHNQGDEHKKKISTMQSKITDVEVGIKKSVRPVRKTQADTNARLDNVRIELQSLQGKIEELQFLLKNQKNRNESFRDDYKLEVKNIIDKLSAMENRLIFVEGFFASEDAGASKGVSQKKKSTGKVKDGEAAKSKQHTDKELYYKAYNNFKEGDIKTAREGFREYLERFPQTTYSDNAQYWIGESFFVEKKYREAILEFEKVIRKYPKGNKTSSALLKQGLAFYRLGDKTSAKLLLQKITKDYPGSEQARIAKRELKRSF